MILKSQDPEASLTASKIDTESDEERLELAKRIAKHQAPAQVRLSPASAKRQLIRLSLGKLLNASSDKSLHQK